MNIYAESSLGSKPKSILSECSQNKSYGNSAFQFRDNRPGAGFYLQLQKMASNSPQAKQLMVLQESINNSPRIEQGILQGMFPAGSGSQSFTRPTGHKFTPASALKATQPIPRGEAKRSTGRGADTGVDVGQVGSYGYVQYLEQAGDGLTGDHQPSGAAVKEAIREMLHTSLNKPLTRLMANNAYQKAITIVMTDVWHKLESRTYGGRNTKSQIINDSEDLVAAAMNDWMSTVPGLEDSGLSSSEIDTIWEDLCKAREDFFATGDAQAGTL